MSDVDLLAAVGLEQGEFRVELAEQVKTGAATMILEAKGHTPTSEEERRLYQAKADELRGLFDDRLRTIAHACSIVPELIGRLGEIQPAERLTVLRTYLPAILEGEAAVARALAVALEAVHEIEAAIERS